jgi:hypothetical protein
MQTLPELRQRWQFRDLSDLSQQIIRERLGIKLEGDMAKMIEGYDIVRGAKWRQGKWRKRNPANRGSRILLFL